MSIFDGAKVRSASVKSKTECNLIVLLSFSIEKLAKENPNILKKIRNVISKRQKQNSIY